MGVTFHHLCHLSLIGSKSQVLLLFKERVIHKGVNIRSWGSWEPPYNLSPQSLLQNPFLHGPVSSALFMSRNQALVPKQSWYNCQCAVTCGHETKCWMIECEQNRCFSLPSLPPQNSSIINATLSFYILFLNREDYLYKNPQEGRATRWEKILE